MGAYIIRRVLFMIPTLLIITIIVFLSSRFIPGNVIEMMVAEMGAEGAVADIELTSQYIRELLGLDVPVHIQYGRWMGQLLQGDLGTSLWTNRSIGAEIALRIPISLELGISSIIIGLLLALPIGVYSAIRQDTGGDYIGRTIAILFISVPSFWLGTMVMVYPSIWWNWMPPIEYIPITKNLAGNIQQFFLPSFILGMVASGTTMRMTRTMMLEVLRQDYIRTAWAKGLTERTVIMRHALKNALIPVVTIVGNRIPFLVGGSVIMETIFSLPGIGRYLIEALNKRDYPIISALNFMTACVVLVGNLLVDLTYGYLDPRVTYK